MPADGCFLRSHARERGDQIGIEACSQRERNGIDGAITVNHIGTKKQRNVQAALLNRGLLIGVNARGGDIEHRAHLAIRGQLHGVNVIANLRIRLQVVLLAIGDSGRSRPEALYCTSWPSFSSSVILASSASTRRSISGETSCGFDGGNSCRLLGRLLGDRRMPAPAPAPALQEEERSPCAQKIALHISVSLRTAVHLR